MATSTRKQREIREREELILDVARGILLERGYLGLTMDRVADATEYSKGTIYQHFPNKEEIVAALAARIVAKHRDLFERAATFRGRPRERIQAIGVADELWVRLNPEDLDSLQIIKSASVASKISAERRAEVSTCEEICVGIVVGIVRDAVAQGDLVLPPEIPPGHVAFTLWAMHFGTYNLVHLDFDLDRLDVSDPFKLLRRNAHVLLDGYAWSPLFAEWDYAASLERIRTELFGAEFVALHSS